MSFIDNVIMPGLGNGATFALIALGFAVLVRTTGVLNFAHGVLIMTGPVLVLVAVQKWHCSTGVAFLIAVLGTVSVALLQERVTIRPFLQVQDSRLPWLLSTLGASIVMAEVLSIPFSSQSEAFLYGPPITPIRSGAFYTTPLQLATIASPFVVVAVLVVFYKRTTVGLFLQSVAQDIDGASAIGISKRRMSQVAAGLAALIAILTGILVAPVQLVNPNLGIGFTFSGFVAAAIGGIGSIEGALVGGFIIGLIGQLADVYIGSLWTDAASFTALLVVYLVRPQGLFGRRTVRAV